MTQHNENKTKRIAQKKLAFELVKDIHGVDIANKCIRISEILFNKSNEELNIEDISMLLGYLPCIEVKKGEKFIEILKNNQIVSSNREAREFISKNTFLIDNNIINDENYSITFNKFNGQYALLKKGKKDFYILKRI